MFGRAKKCRTELEHAIMDRSILSDTHPRAERVNSEKYCPGMGNSATPGDPPGTFGNQLDFANFTFWK